MNNLNKITINCFNWRGLRNNQKRQNVFTWPKSNHSGITFLQESHSTSSDEKKWAKEWGGDIYFSHGEFNARGVAILIPKNLDNKFIYKNGYRDDYGRFILINCKIDETQLTLINIYCPTKDNQTAQITFLDIIKTQIEEYGDTNIILGGDLNTYLDINIDKKGGKLEHLQIFTNFKKYMWRILSNRYLESEKSNLTKVYSQRK